MSLFNTKRYPHNQISGIFMIFKLPSLSNIFPHILLFIFSWHMTVGPGALLLHHLKSFHIYDEQFIPIDRIVSDEKKKGMIKLSPAQLINIPYIRQFFYLLSIPCFSLLYYFLTFLRKSHDPDILLFFNTFLPIIVSSIKLGDKKKSLILGLVSLFVTFITLRIQGSYDLLANSTFVIPFIYGIIFLQYFAFTNSINQISKFYFRYSHPPISLFNFEGCYSVLQNIYSSFWHFLITVWHHFDTVLSILYILIRVFSPPNIHPSKFLIFFSIISNLLSLPCVKCFIQLKLILMMLPIFNQKKDSSPDEVHKLVTSIGEFAFSITALQSHLLLLNIGWIYCSTFHFSNSDTYLAMLECMIFSGTVFSSTSRVFSLFLTLPFIQKNDKY